MPVRKLEWQKPTPAVDRLRSQLAEEWANATSQSQQPVILEHRDRSGHLVHVYVIWDDREWIGLTGVERSEIIMDACAQRYGSDETSEVVVAMGLTTAEADRMGLKYA